MSKRARPDGHAAEKDARRPRIESSHEKSAEQVQKKSARDAIFAAGRFHDLGVVPALGDHIHGEKVNPNCQWLSVEVTQRAVFCKLNFGVYVLTQPFNIITMFSSFIIVCVVCALCDFWISYVKCVCAFVLVQRRWGLQHRH